MRLIFIFLILVGGYHIISVWLIFGIELTDSKLLAVTRDAIWSLLVLFLLYKIWPKKFKKFFNDRGYEIFILFLLSARAIWLSLYQGVGRSDIVIWYKYNIWYLTVALTAVFVWHTSLKHKHKYIEALGEKFYRGIGVFLVWWLTYQGLKMWFPDLFMSLWYWPVGDYAVWTNPPIRYRTGPWGMTRLQWLFSWPNNYWYFLVAIFSFFIVTSRHIRNDDTKDRRKVVLMLVLYSISLIWTLSRWAYVWVAIQILILWLMQHQKVLKKKLSLFWLWLFAIGWLFVLVVVLSLIKSWSTAWHISAWQEWWSAFLQNPLWYGLWISWPSVHHDGIYLPESQFLQIMIDLWVVWILFWIISRKILLTPALEHLLDEKKIKKLPLYSLLALGIIGLLIEWFFLHTFEDSMVNYLILIPFGILLGMSRDETHL